MILQLKNVSLLFVAQLISYLIPILEVPILARALGVESYGHILIVQTTALLCSLVVEYGFSLSGARQVALCAENKTLLSKIYNEVVSGRIILAVGVVSFSLVVLFFVKVDASPLVFYGDIFIF